MLDQAPVPKPRNPRTQARLRREVFWQIALPITLAVILTLTLMALTVTSTAVPTRSAFADVSVIFLIIPTALWGLVLLALVVAVCVGLIYALRELPPLFKQAQDFMALVAAQTNKYAGQTINGVYSVRSFADSARQTVARIRSTFPFSES